MVLRRGAATVHGVKLTAWENPAQKREAMSMVKPTNPSITWDTFRVVVIREVTTAECPWLRQDIPVGRELFVGVDAYRVCSPSGLAVTERDSEYLFEVPLDAVVGILES